MGWPSLGQGGQHVEHTRNPPCSGGPCRPETLWLVPRWAVPCGRGDRARLPRDVSAVAAACIRSTSRPSRDRLRLCGRCRPGHPGDRCRDEPSSGRRSSSGAACCAVPVDPSVIACSSAASAGRRTRYGGAPAPCQPCRGWVLGAPGAARARCRRPLSGVCVHVVSAIANNPAHWLLGRGLRCCGLRGVPRRASHRFPRPSPQ